MLVPFSQVRSPCALFVLYVRSYSQAGKTFQQKSPDSRVQTADLSLILTKINRILAEFDKSDCWTSSLTNAQ